MDVSQFVSRLPKGHPPHLADDLPVAFGIASNFRAKVSEIRADKFLSDEGKNAAIVRALRNGPIEHLSQLRRDVADKLADARTKRENLRQRVIGAENYPEHLKAETRMWLRGLDASERLRVVTSTNDPLIIEAMAGAPAFLSGVASDVRDRAIDAAIKAAHGEAMARIDVLESSYEEAAAVLDVAEDMLRRESGLDKAVFAAAAA